MKKKLNKSQKLQIKNKINSKTKEVNITEPPIILNPELDYKNKIDNDGFYQFQISTQDSVAFNIKCDTTICDYKNLETCVEGYLSHISFVNQFSAHQKTITLNDITELLKDNGFKKGYTITTI